MHKLSTNNVDDLPLFPLVLDIGALTNQTAKNLAKSLPPLGTSKYIISNAKGSVKHIRKEKVPLRYEMV